MSSSRWGGTPQCPRCQKAVYMAEQAIGPNGAWHKTCLACIDCNKRLDSFTLAEHEGEAYCKVCHGRRYGPKGYGFASGSSFLSTDKPLKSRSMTTLVNDQTSKLDRLSSSPPTSPSSPSLGFFSSRPQSPKGPRRAFTLPNNNDICPRCSKAVYAAEARREDLL
ncbi:1787_t:CDS:2 [Entrophospora sp. SA101]|nr:1787_t:CDS:2 [Entrophospora sp. SA101]